MVGPGWSLALRRLPGGLDAVADAELCQVGVSNAVNSRATIPAMSHPGSDVIFSFGLKGFEPASI